MNQADQRLVAYVINPALDMPLVPAPIERAWMNAWHDRAPYRCLPMVIANQAGWVMNNSTSFTAVWNGGHSQDSLRIDFGPPPAPPVAAGSFGFGVLEIAPRIQPAPPVQPDPFITSLFGGGVLTFNIPYLFRTPPGVNLWVKGPTNFIKDGVQALEAVVESDWIVASFTMNWKLTRPNHPVRFERGEPICMVLPTPRGLTESLEPVRLPLSSDPAMLEEYQAWEQKRDTFNTALEKRDPDAVRRGWQRDYFQGLKMGGIAAAEHQTKLRLKPFTDLQP